MNQVLAVNFFHRPIRIGRLPICCLAILILVFANVTGSAWGAENQNVIELESHGEFTMKKGGDKALARSLGIFSARRAAVETAGKYLARKESLWLPEKKKTEIFDLAADRISSRILEEKWTEVGDSLLYHARIRTVVKLSDFVDSEIENSKLEKKSAKKSLREMMEPVIEETLQPGHDLAEAYRLIRTKNPRAAIIYLNRLDKKYADWPELLLVKAVAFYELNEFEQMNEALKRACKFGNEVACKDLEMLHRVDNFQMK